MATNAPTGDAARKGAVRKRSQHRTEVMGENTWTKRDRATGKPVDQKKGARSEEVQGRPPREGRVTDPHQTRSKARAHQGAHMTNLLKLPTWAEDGFVYAVAETPRGSTCKLDYDPELGPRRRTAIPWTSWSFMTLRPSPG